MFQTMERVVIAGRSPIALPNSIIRRDCDGSMEMVTARWGLRPKELDQRPFNVVRAEGRTFEGHRCLIPASKFSFQHEGRGYRFTLMCGDWFYFAGIWRHAYPDWPEAYAALTIEANMDVAPYNDRQMAVILRRDRMAWIDATQPDEGLLRPLPAGTFMVERDDGKEIVERRLL